MGVDNFSLYDIYEKEQCRKAAKLPVCDICGEPIYGEYGYRIKEYMVCEYCIEESKEYIEED